MWISPRFNALFIHCPKTAGTSLRNLFGQLDPGIILFENHRTATQGRAVIHEQTWNRLFKFSTCRHPCDQLVSHYRNIARQPDHFYHTKTTRAGFSEWLRWKESELDISGVCVRYIDLPMDFVMRFETIEQDFETLKIRLGIDASVYMPRANVGNNSPVDWRDWFTPADIDFVRENFRKDFTRFDYPIPRCDEARRA